MTARKVKINALGLPTNWRFTQPPPWTISVLDFIGLPT
jgi:hypothetical protein